MSRYQVSTININSTKKWEIRSRFKDMILRARYQVKDEMFAFTILNFEGL